MRAEEREAGPGEVEHAQSAHNNLVGMILADYGAEALKIEPPSGDSYRGHPARDFWNRGKGSRVLDLRTTPSAESWSRRSVC